MQNPLNYIILFTLFFIHPQSVFAAKTLCRGIFSVDDYANLPNTDGDRVGDHEVLKTVLLGLKHGHFLASSKLLETYLSENPHDYRAWTMLANTYIRMGRDADARELRRKIVSIEGPNTRNLNDLASSLFHVAPREALLFMNRALEMDPTDIKSLTFQAKILLKLGQEVEAALSIDKGLALNPNDIVLLDMKARFLMSKAFIDEAHKVIDLILRINPHDRRALSLKAAIPPEL